MTTDLDRIEVVPDPNDHIHTMLTMVNDIKERLCAMRWLVAKFDEPALLSGDHPMTFYAEPEKRSPMVGIGLMTADEVRFPLDPRTMLVMTWQPIKECVFTMPMDGARDLNQAHARPLVRIRVHAPESGPRDRAGLRRATSAGPARRWRHGRSEL